MRVWVKKCGDGALVRIPDSVMRTMRLSLDQEVDVCEENGRIVIEQLSAPKCELDALLQGINADNLHAEVDF